MVIFIELSDLSLGAAAFFIDYTGESIMNIKRKSEIKIKEGYNIFHGGTLVLPKIKKIVPTRHSFSGLLMVGRLFKENTFACTSAENTQNDIAAKSLAIRSPHIRALVVIDL